MECRLDAEGRTHCFSGGGLTRTDGARPPAELSVGNPPKRDDLAMPIQEDNMCHAIAVSL